jgi:hypothetical protein
MDTKDIIVRISRLTKKEKKHILNILVIHDIEFSKNANGYFFNLTNVDSVVIEKVNKCLELIEANRDLIKEMDKRRDELLGHYKGLIEDKLKVSMQLKMQRHIQRLMICPVQSKIQCTTKRGSQFEVRETDADPDVLMKEHLKGRKYAKGSVYHRIMSKYRTARNNKINMDGAYEADGQLEDAPNDYANEEIDEIASEPDLNPDKDGDDYTEIEADVDALDGVDENGNEDLDVDDIEGVGLDVSDDEHKDDEEDEATEQTDLLFEHYKNLLNKKGYQFGDKNAVIVYEEYIA